MTIPVRPRFMSTKKKLTPISFFFLFALINNVPYFPAALLHALKASGLTMLALSHDSRYSRDAMPMENLLFTIRLCEEVRMPYQLVFTEGSEMERLSAVMTLRLILDSDLELMQPVASELVDIGGAADFPPERFSHQLNIAPCQDRGFYRPHYLHVAPDGKVRSCMFAYGSSNVGDLTKEPLHAMLNRFPWSPIAEVFANKEKKEEARLLMKPYGQGYKPPVHECTRNIELARAFERPPKINKRDS